MKPPDFSRLRSSLVKIGVVVGLDETSPLRKLNKDSIGSDLDSASVTYEEQLLFAVSGQVAAVTSGDGVANGEHAANGGTTPSEARSATLLSDQCPPFSELFSKAATAVPPVKECWIRPDTCATVIPVSADKPSMPIDWDIIGTLGIFCCPEGVKLSTTKRDPHCHGLVLTDLTGMRTYGSCLTFYRPFRLTRKEIRDCALNGSGANTPVDPYITPYRLQPCSEKDGSMRDPVYYVPTCVCLVSEYAYHTVLKDCLSGLLPSLLSAANSRELMRILSSFLAHASLVPIPPAGGLSVSFTSSGKTFLCSAASDPGRPVADMQLNYPFLFFDKLSILRLITCLLTEQRIIFVSSSASACVMVMECLLCYILPFVWRQHYVPVLPQRLVGLTEVPGQYLMGVHPDFVDEIEIDTDIVFANLDTGVVTVNDSIGLPPMPEIVAEGFLQKIQERSWNFDRITDRPTFATPEEEKQARIKHQETINTTVKDACFQMLAQLFSPMDDFITSDRKQSQFNKVNFIKKFADSDHAFYKMVCNTTMFSFFQEDRTSRRDDVFWRDVTIWKRQNRMSGIGHRASIRTSTGKEEPDTGSPQLSRRVPTTMSIKRTSVHATDGCSTPAIMLPEFDVSRHSSPSAYHQDCIAVISEKLLQLGSSNSPSLLSACHYLQALLHDACGQVLRALRDFDEISSASMFPKSVASMLFSQLGEADREAFRSTSTSFERRIERSNHDDIPRNTDRVPGALDNSKFLLFMKQNGILDNAETAGSLFRIIQRKPGHLLESAAVQSLRVEWQELAQYINLNDACSHVDAAEVDLYTSSVVVRSSIGVGRLVLTTRSVKILINERRHQLADLQKISRIEKYRLRERLSFLSVDALRFIKEGEEVALAPYACLKDDRDLWYDIITEMKEGIRCSLAQNYAEIIKFAAQNILVYLALLRLRYPSSSESGLPLEKTARGMLYYTVLKLPKLPGDIGKALMQRFNPSEHDATPGSIESLEYVPPSLTYASEDSGRLWCGLGMQGTGCVKVLDAETFQLEFDIRCEGRATSLLQVGSHVWIGCSDKSITVVEAENGQVLYRFLKHQSMVTALVIGSTGLVWSGSVMGQVIGWDPSRLTMVHEVALAPRDSLINCLLVYNGWIWCSGQSNLILINEANPDLRETVALASNVRISCLAVSSAGQIWAGGSRNDSVYIVDGQTRQLVDNVPLPMASTGVSGIYSLMAVGDKMWSGRKNGYVDIWDSQTKRLVKEVKAHTDGIRSMCMKEDCVVTGPGSSDGVVAIWDPTQLSR